MSRPVETAAGGAGEFVRPTGARSDRIHQAILVATAELLDEGGFPAATMDAIAARSGASKATLYKHWPSRTAVAAEAFGTMMAEALPLPDTGSTATDLTEQVVRVSAFYASARGEVFAQLLAACVEDTTGAAYFREYFLSGRRAAITELWRRGVDRGGGRRRHGDRRCDRHSVRSADLPPDDGPLSADRGARQATGGDRPARIAPRRPLLAHRPHHHLRLGHRTG
ncbi:TetR family transcriptional regulator [Mycolicibacterium fortuitum subsp. fortuitum DSM 46621 = ATCC 6841 = JCM 6387]|uniref:TetR family transcriptional regulator n=1 Tax=Mycolicibacterium fortuitum subsp. fortuitum DSM 46621 = ATCC 6841 = JCM 6387 TaxID=1214102 RepID=K0UQK2_MYCFO|nr:TetR family transcriptional regulator [Mycolicibacterium fortuitum subsp. fortuitum DSM 46621 = ATCC 6841 = JCM 6387]